MFLPFQPFLAVTGELDNPKLQARPQTQVAEGQQRQGRVFWGLSLSAA